MLLGRVSLLRVGSFLCGPGLVRLIPRLWARSCFLMLEGQLCMQAKPCSGKTCSEEQSNHAKRLEAEAVVILTGQADDYQKLGPECAKKGEEEIEPTRDVTSSREG